jgi:hypothetical protein
VVAGRVIEMSAAVSPRAQFEFASLAKAEFSFLTADFGLQLVEEGETRVRYESQRRFVNVYHARGSYQVGVEVGRWIEVDGELREGLFPLVHLLAVEAGESQLDRIRTATDRDQLARELHRLASLLKARATPLLTNGDDLFDRMSELNSALSNTYLEGIRASRLRARADEAWRQKDFETVALAYTEIERELTTVSLHGSERARLEYAKKHGAYPF